MSTNNKTNKYQKFEELPVWIASYELSLSVYKATKNFPKDEQFGLTSQIRRSSSSVGANIAEGFYKKTTKDLVHYLYNARGSAGETLHHLYLAKDLDYITVSDFDYLKKQAQNVLIQLSAWANSLIRNGEIKK